MSKPTRQGKCRRLSVLPFLFFICARYVFPILSGKGLGLPRFCRKAAPFGGLVGQKKIILASFSFAKPCAKRQSKGRRPIKSGKHIPIGLFILKNLKFKDMKLRLIENICKRTVSLVLLTGICLLYSKGIIPVYLIVLFLLSGTLISLLFRTFTLIVKIIIALTVMGMLV